MDAQHYTRRISRKDLDQEIAVCDELVIKVGPLIAGEQTIDLWLGGEIGHKLRVSRIGKRIPRGGRRPRDMG